MSKPNVYFVRLKPYNKKRGYLARNYMYRGVRLTERWKKVSSAMAHEIEALVQPHDIEEEIPLCDVCTEPEAKKIEDKERDKLGAPSSLVSEAEPLPNRKFREVKQDLDGDGELMNAPEPAETIAKDEIKDIKPSEPDFDSDDDDPEPAPSLRGAKGSSSSKKRSRARTRD